MIRHFKTPNFFRVKHLPTSEIEKQKAAVKRVCVVSCCEDGICLYDFWLQCSGANLFN